jgi:hypothetical protein
VTTFRNIRDRFRLSTDAAAVWTALALALLVRWGWLKHIPW